MVVAEITKDLISADASEAEFNQIGRQFDYEAMCNWWGWNDLPVQPFIFTETPKTMFKLYDDDYELYYEGWLINDDECIVQQFVLDWGKAYAGCTTIKVHKPNPVPGEGGGEYVQEIG